MDGQLLVRVYNVGCGDCILVRVPDTDRDYHFLVDCGNCSADKWGPLGLAMKDVCRELTQGRGAPADGTCRLDLLVATHKHWDHLKGFESEHDAFKQMQIDRIWLTVGMDEGHPEARELRGLTAYTRQSVGSLQRMGLELSPGLHTLLMNSIGTDTSAAIICETLPREVGTKPLYVYRGFEEDLSRDVKESQLFRFRDPSIKLRVLAPEKDIDGAYMGRARALLKGLGEHGRHVSRWAGMGQVDEWPVNMSKSDFRRLRERMMYTSLEAAVAEGHAINNTSVVLLLEWRGQRLLFPGDAEWTPGAGEGAKEGSWEVMWGNESVKTDLAQPLDFLKVAHHGSRNATPWNLDDPDDSVNEILDTILPPAAPGGAPTARAVVSTCAGKIPAKGNPVPKPELMQELGRRVENCCSYPDKLFPQPQRTDMEDLPHIDVTFDPA